MILIKNIYTLFGRKRFLLLVTYILYKRFLLPVKYFPASFCLLHTFRFTLRVTGIIRSNYSKTTIYKYNKDNTLLQAHNT